MASRTSDLGSPPSLRDSPSPQVERRPRGEDAHLLPLSDGKQTAILLQTPRTTIGRAADCEVIVDDRRVSRLHAIITRDGERYLVRDAGSLNGTFVNGRRLLANTPTRLYAGDELGLADLRFRFVSGPADQPYLPPDRLRIDDVAAEVFVGGSRVALAPKEYALLRALWQRSGRICSKEWLARSVWPEYQGVVSDASIEAAVSRLRRKLAAGGGRRAWVRTEPRRGYRLVGDEE
ncbi:MAG: hypothetical protein CL878_14575 [Dehalococcoidia bacterium]|nr:hypothetical protein [Dehalococcoidia bacterium]